MRQDPQRHHCRNESIGYSGNESLICLLPSFPAFEEPNSGRDLKGKYIPAHRIVIQINFLQILDAIRCIGLCQFGNECFWELIGEEEVVLLEVRVGDFLLQQLYVVLGGSHEVDCLQVHQFLPHIFDLLDEIHVILVQFGLRIDDGYDARGFRIEDESLHLRNLPEDSIEVVLGNGQQVVLFSLALLHQTSESNITLIMQAQQQ